MTASLHSPLEISLQALIDCAEHGEWDKLDQIAGQLIPALDAANQATPGKAANAAEIRQLLSKLQTAIDRCTDRQAQIGPLLDAFSHKTPDRDSV
jgi:hypothetical protein